MTAKQKNRNLRNFHITMTVLTYSKKYHYIQASVRYR